MRRLWLSGGLGDRQGSAPLSTHSHDSRRTAVFLEMVWAGNLNSLPMAGRDVVVF
jgi:hypothetical protein